MKRFVELFHAVDRTTRTSEKTAALRSYFDAAPPEDAVWALRVFTGQKLARAVPYPRLKQWAAEAAGLEPWLFTTCYDAVGDLSETLALVLPDPAAPQDLPLHAVVRDHILPLAQMTEAEQHVAIRSTWDRLDRDARFLFHKLISGNFRFGAAKKVVINALAAAADVEPAVMQHRLGGRPSSPRPKPSRRCWPVARTTPPGPIPSIWPRRWSRSPRLWATWPTGGWSGSGTASGPRSFAAGAPRWCGRAATS